jgi:hypothetical protein
MDIEVELVSSSINVELDSSQTIEVLSDVTAINFGDLIDFNDADKNDQYVIMYDANTQKYKLVNPDKVLSSASSTETLQPGLPTDFKDQLDIDLDDRIDLDAGNF